RDWARNGAASPHVPALDERRRRAHAPDTEDTLAAANFRLGEYLFDHDRADAARPYFEEAKRLRPESWTYRRQTWANYDPGQNAGLGWYRAMLALEDEPYYDPPWLGEARGHDPAETARRQRRMLSDIVKPFLPPDA